MNNTTGPTKDAGWEVGVRRTVGVSPNVIWAFLLGDGLPIWLGNTKLRLDKGARYETDDDIAGHVISYSPNARLRMTWQPGEWEHDSVLHVYTKATPEGTVIGFQQERLKGREERKIMLGHWKDILEQLDAGLLAQSGK
ncbi:SRPBCC domain-containing protein [Glaciihabitans sp. dw_435]|uniref:SRPBCC domain-containing protein n=1 Tax=Glaciihabitans sp. dw_435 TaxID=2720081 RepID=UPI001BD5408D|nr:SRPBCC domain-containing protein [Glaciihabitans sp. dw_435]